MLKAAAAVILVAGGLWCSYQLAVLGEPQSAWLWCDLGGQC